MQTTLVASAKWYIGDFYTNSDHLAIVLEIQNRKSPGKISKAQNIGWKHRCFDEEAFKHTWLNSRPQETRNDAIKLHQTLENRLKLACDAAMPRRSFTPEFQCLTCHMYSRGHHARKFRITNPKFRVSIHTTGISSCLLMACPSVSITICQGRARGPIIHL